jgi:hypothetical protein
MPPRSRDQDIYVATESGSCEVAGENHVFVKGITRVRAGHPLLKAVPDYFKPIELEVHYDVEQATAAPGERRGQA